MQSEAVIEVIRWGFSLAPAAVWLITAAVLFGYNMDRDGFEKIVAALRARRGTEAE